jgi:hypothetical protein
MARGKSKVVTIPKMPDPQATRKPRSTDPRYVDGQKILVEAMSYLAKTDPDGNRDAVSLLSEHFRTNFRMSDRPSTNS